ncbi:MAG: sensor histidine kinase, partial [Elusimicrobiota bacterium]
YYWEIFREKELTDMIDTVKKSGENLLKEININNKHFLCSAAYLDKKDEIIILFNDITKFRKLDKLKKDFVVNVSHELKTPLTAIKGYVETLDEEIKSKQSKHYINILKRHTNRLINIVEDLLLLSELEEETIEIEFKKANLKQIILDIAKVYEQKIKSKSLQLKIEIQDDLPEVEADPFKIEQMLINLIDNAVKYTEQGEIKIEAHSAEDNIEIKISDTGIGISSDDIERIFERFYVADKSRSRKMGGTGLGLSIVKHIVILHNGKINVNSTPLKGTEFIINLPVNQQKST